MKWNGEQAKSSTEQHLKDNLVRELGLALTRAPRASEPAVQADSVVARAKFTASYISYGLVADLPSLADYVKETGQIVDFTPDSRLRTTLMRGNIDGHFVFGEDGEGRICLWYYHPRLKIGVPADDRFIEARWEKGWETKRIEKLASYSRTEILTLVQKSL